ncbi:12S rRNA N4-methylcytidine (m4C) methyltransferase isoform X1 [Prionailurus viverrinus]|uniref:12S rRNA N4-methylcytidine (m4C) methyltransferase isoform X1 n=2 Tax=Prionailurus viverrinus TaxID=61388 RepID=UPI001FF698B9|nr:12S rRNA N4-methylcytidine (m4C) methyltransferase isoform X1 [Prionailurus viverrinus]XP_047734506.1 12S rRNA N4-methylcytidine (m4C) methyltransferase isoform X1 [Prionailurus viverrinus]XP_047734507.1 12S rRNA N4-methylcytidine (m4C) methyltransferase isoform X1 [Prionailurus viverrinus]XP_047734508.1 12S rRNA N4-methylcytidine (m4C) methyltransferase isoform X1 [Prionailurus viverrinus]
MLRYPYFCKIYKEFHSCWLESGIFNLGIWPKKIHATTERCNEYEAEEQTDQTGAQELHRSQNGDFEAMTKLHIPVMVDEVVRCLAPQKGQGYMISCKNVNGETKFFQMSFLIRFYRTTLYLCLHYLCPGRLTFPGQIIWLPCPVASGWITQMGVTSWRSESEIFLDMTFGSGGHTRAILQKESDITLYALDRDPTAYAIAEQLSEFYPKQIRAMLGQFSQAEALLMKAGVQPGTLDGVLLDLGCSSMQLDAPERGFSLRKDGPLDMRMDGGRYPDMPTAADVVNALDQQALASILRTYGEEKHAKKIASAIVQARSLYPISRTQQLASIVAGAFPPSAIFARKDLLQRSTHIATKTFQAFRIFVNNELNELYIGLKTAQKFLRPGGRLVALSFHSLEDRIVKRFLLGISMTERFNLSARQKVIQASQLRSSYENKEGDSISRAPLMWELIHKKVLTPEDQDVQDNPRARSAKLRAAIKL